VGEHNQSPFAGKHPPPDYQDDDRERCWDINYLDTRWVDKLNEGAETAFRKNVLMRCPEGLTDEEREKRICDAGKKKQPCVVDKDARRSIVDVFMTHLAWHPYITDPDASQDTMMRFNAQQIWREQTTEMHEVCKSLGEAWAWEYMFKHWYRPSRWKLWARAICKEIPIIQSNAIVESVWSVLKKQHLRRHYRPKLEFLIHVIMNEYLPKLWRQIRCHRDFDDPNKPVWYAFFRLN